MSVYLVDVKDTKEGVCYPTIIGPFATDDEAQAFADKYELGQVDPWSGGYGAVHVVSDATSEDPEDYAEQRRVNHEEDDA